MNRIELLNFIPKNGIVVEMGVCAGEFSKEILIRTSPSKLFLVDIWGHISLNYNDDNMVSNPKHEERYRYVFKNFKDDNRVKLIRSLTDSLLELFPENYFDWSYVDADHSYEGCLKDLNISKKIVKENGYILGHDYMYKFPGVIQAVDQFVKENNYYLTYLTDKEKNPSYLISKNVNSHTVMKNILQI
jgi:hypothetical protein